jgi:hypothetical protein
VFLFIPIEPFNLYLDNKIIILGVADKSNI